MNKLTLESLTVAVRGASDLTSLKRLVGPSDQEIVDSNRRVRALDALSPACEWSNPFPRLQALDARERWNRIMSEQKIFENMYC